MEDVFVPTLICSDPNADSPVKSDMTLRDLRSAFAEKMANGPDSQLRVPSKNA